MGNDKTYIRIEHGEVRKEIKEKLGTSYLSIKKALDFSRNTELSEKIRKLALEKGGELIEYKIIEK